MLAMVVCRETTRVETIAQLDEVLDAIAAKVAKEASQDVEVTRGNGDCLRLILGAPGGCVLSYTPPSGDPPYLVSLGDAKATGVFAFWLEGHHHTEVDVRHVINQVDAREAIRRFVQMPSGMPSNVKWEEV